MCGFIFEDTDNLPEGWLIIPLGELIHAMNPGFASGKHNQMGQGTPHLRPMNISSDGKIDLSQIKYVVVEDYDALVQGDVLFNNTNSPDLLGKTAYIPSDTDSTYSNHMTRLRFYPDIMEPRWIAYYLNYLFKTGYFKLNATNHVNQSSINIQFLSGVPVLFPPLNEQQRIVDEIEAQFSRLDTWLEVMQKLREQLPRLRASILKAAVEGRLIEQDPDDEPAEVLLQRILDERRRKWEEDYLADLEAKGKPAPKDDKWKAKYPEPEGPDTDGLPELPNGWVWATPDQLASPEDYSLAIGPFGSNLKVDDYQDSGVPLVFVRNIRSGDFDDTYYITPQKAEELRAHTVSPNDILITKMGDPPGDAIVYPSAQPIAVITADCIKWKLASFLPYPELYVHFMHSPLMKAQMLEITRGVAQKKVSLGRFKKIVVPVPPLDEQKRIIDIVDSMLSLTVRLGRTIEVNTKRAERMRQAILKQAFEGRLVEQDPNDEPASELLERIQEERQRRAEEERQKPRQQRERKVSNQIERKSLYETLKEAGKPLSARELFQQAGFTHETIDDFYEELREAVHESEIIRSKRNKNNEVYLEVTG